MINKAKNDFNYEFDDHEVDIKVCVTFAGRGGHFVLVKTLIEKLKGGLDDIMIKDMLMFACESGNTDLIEYVLGQGSDDYEQGFINACACGNISVIDFMFELYVMTLSDTNNFNFKHTTEYGLYNAVRIGHLDVVKYFIEKRQRYCSLIFFRRLIRTVFDLQQIDILKYLLQQRDNLQVSLDEFLEDFSVNGHDNIWMLKLILESGECDCKFAAELALRYKNRKTAKILMHRTDFWSKFKLFNMSLKNYEWGIAGNMVVNNIVMIPIIYLFVSGNVLW